jgi:hypothetical protein
MIYSFLSFQESLFGIISRKLEDIAMTPRGDFWKFIA